MGTTASSWVRQNLLTLLAVIAIVVTAAVLATAESLTEQWSSTKNFIAILVMIFSFLFLSCSCIYYRCKKTL